MNERVELTASDGVKLVGDHYPAGTKEIGVLLIHMMPATRQSWGSFIKNLNAAGVGALAIDLRGHGESEKGPQGYESFSDEEHRASIMDVRAGVAYLREQRYGKIFVGGASIGANLTLETLAEDPSIKKGILLSPGLNYRGLETLPLAKKINPDQGVYIVAAKDDVADYGNCGKMGQEIYDALATDKKEVMIFDAGGHGTTIFDTHPDAIERLAGWIKS